MKTLQRNHLWLGVLIALALQACATTSGEGLSNGLHKADRAITEIMLLATDLRTQGLINDEDWPKVKQWLNEARSEMTEAWAAEDADPEGAEQRLGSIEDILGRLTNSVPELQRAPSVPELQRSLRYRGSRSPGGVRNIP